MSDGQRPVRWESWHAAFEEGGRQASQDRPKDAGVSVALRRLVTPDDFAKALAEIVTARVLGDMGPRHQEACRTGILEWWDGRGRCVVLVREGSREARAWPGEDAVMAAMMERNGPKVGDPGPVLGGQATVIAGIEEVRPGLTMVTHAPPPEEPASGIVAAVKPVLPKGKKK